MIVDGEILSYNINLIVKILGEKIDGILFEDDCMSASKDNITVKVDVNMKTKISFIMPIEIAKMIKKLPKQPLKIQHRNQEIKIASENQIYRFTFENMINSDMFVDKNRFQKITRLPFEEFHNKVEAAIPVSRHSITSGIGGLMMIGDGKTLNIIGTNTYCLAWYRMKCDSNFKICVDDRISKLFNVKYNGNVTISVNENHVAFTLGHYTIFLTTIETKYPNIEHFKNTSQSLHINRTQCLDVIKRLQIIKDVPVMCKAYGQDIILKIKKGRNIFAEKISIINPNLKTNTNGFCFSFNPKYLETILKALDDDVIKIGYDIGGKFVTFSDKSGMWALAIVK